MFDRGEFIRSIAYTLAASAAPGAATKPTPVPSDADGDGLCEKNLQLPYDRPIRVEMRVLDGPDLDSSKYVGNVIWMNIFATWCGPCNREQPGVVALAKKYADRGLQVIGINVREQDDTVRAYRKKFGIEYPIAMDEHGQFADALGDRDKNQQQAYPAHLLIDRNGYLSCYIVGGLPEELIAPELEKLLGHAPSASSQPA